MMRLYSYIVAVDDGFAPCPMPGLCSLACCKPMIRRLARQGDWVMGTMPKERGEGRLVYLMQVGRVLSFADYYRDQKLRRRRDCIYRPLKCGGFRQKGNPWHGHSNIKKDLSGKNVLLAKRFVYFGENAQPVPPAFRRYVARGQGHRVWGTPGAKAPNTIRPDTIKSLVQWAFSRGCGVRGKPFDPPRKHTNCE